MLGQDLEGRRVDHTAEDMPPVEASDAKDRKAAKARSRRLARRRQRFSPITRKILAVNLLTLFVPILGLLYLGPYRDSLIEQEITALTEQGKVFSGALGESAIGLLTDGRERLNLGPAQDLVRRLSEASEVRARFFLADGTLIADSRQLGRFGLNILIEDLADPTEDEGTLEPVLGPVAQVLTDLSHWLDNRNYPLFEDIRNPRAENYPEALAALSGETSSMVRQDENRNLVLSVALPVQRYVHIFGTLQLTRGGSRVDEAMNSVRLTIAGVFVGALIFTTLLSLYFASTIARPLRRLAEAAERMRHAVGGASASDIPDLTVREDEIGDLSGVLRELTEALTARLTAIERFAADVSHEIKNPLTSLKSAIETVERVSNPDHQRDLLRIIREDVDRLDRLITDISDASRLDAELSRHETARIDFAEMLELLVGMRSTAQGESGPALSMERRSDGPFIIMGIEGRLVQVIQNLIGNAISFSPDDGKITLSIAREKGWIVARCEDEGPGIPAAKLEAVFDRFYSERPGHEKFGAHSGLGLSICKQIIEAHSGTITAENRLGLGSKTIGARFVVKLPAVVG